MHDWRARHYDIKIELNGGPVEARHHNFHRVYSDQHTNTTDFVLKLWNISLSAIYGEFQHWF